MSVCLCLIGPPVYQLDGSKMGCHDHFPVWAIVVIAVGTVVILLTAIILMRKWEVIRFYLFMHFNILVKDNQVENIKDMDTGNRNMAFTCYSCFSS